jgi:tRNA-Thr(GGU) m(6)t(6)A37 methyltransferase TsaA
MNTHQVNKLQGPMQLRPIGMIHTPFKKPKGTPIQPPMSKGAEGTVSVFKEFEAGLKDLEGFERVWLVYWFHRAPKARLLVTPFLDDRQHGLFSSRAPARPNPIGISAVRLLRVERNILTVADVDILDGTPLLDIKPYVPQFDCYRVKSCGWLSATRIRRRLADGRFQGDAR